MSVIAISKGFGSAVMLAAGAMKYMELKTPHFPNASEFYHGTTTSRWPGNVEDFVVKGSLFFTPDFEYAQDYALGAPSAFRLNSEDKIGDPVVLHLSVPEGTPALRGIFGGHAYFPHGTKVTVHKVTYVSKLSPEEQEYNQWMNKTDDI